jgi:hypothetical protein
VAVPGEAGAGGSDLQVLRALDAALTVRGYLAMGGQIIDATVVPPPK